MVKEVSAQEITAGIARLMPGWSVEKSDCSWSATLKGPDGEGLHIDTSYHRLGRDKIRINGVYPREGGNHFGQAVTSNLPEIGVSVSRPAADIVKEINRRLLPRYREVLAKAREAQERHHSFQNGIEALAEELAKLVGYKKPPERPSHRSAGYVDIPSDSSQFYGSAQINSPESVDIAIHSARPEVARRVLKALMDNGRR